MGAAWASIMPQISSKGPSAAKVSGVVLSTTAPSLGWTEANRTRPDDFQMSAFDAVDGSSRGTRVPRCGRHLRLPPFGGAFYAVDFDNRSGYRQVGLSSTRR